MAAPSAGGASPFVAEGPSEDDRARLSRPVKLSPALVVTSLSPSMAAPSALLVLLNSVPKVLVSSKRPPLSRARLHIGRSEKTMFSGLMSRCRMPLACRYSRPSSRSRNTLRATASSRYVWSGGRLSGSITWPPRRSSITRKMRSPIGSSMTSKRWMQFGWRTCFITAISLSTASETEVHCCVCGLPICFGLPSRLVFSRSRPLSISLIATTSPRNSSDAWYTAPKAPLPSNPLIQYWLTRFSKVEPDLVSMFSTVFSITPSCCMPRLTSRRLICLQEQAAPMVPKHRPVLRVHDKRKSRRLREADEKRPQARRSSRGRGAARACFSDPTLPSDVIFTGFSLSARAATKCLQLWRR